MLGHQCSDADGRIDAMHHSIGLFTVGIFGPFFIHSSFIFNIILIPFFQKNETENEKENEHF
jgi:hypothetical protein